ncbi:MBL fold metallo-hydrolase [Streptomyces sp. NPDC085932]|uniref:MBL fold metallo-hydrolase n=1 Tax=Streptomyces sp. NPDC085932 TaxID=3365741 RepID=UPI0037D4C458
MAKSFASAEDNEEKEENLEVLDDGVYALTTGGDPNVGAIEGEDFLVCFEARATPVMAKRWLDQLREHTDKPIKYLVLSHYHAVRTLGASAFDADVIVAHAETKRLIAERGQQDWASEFGRMPRLFVGHETIPGLTWPTLTFADRLSIDLGGSRGTVELAWAGRGHTSGDIYAWLPEQRILFAGDLVENGSAVYTGDAYHQDWRTTTLDNVASLGARMLVGGRGHIARTPKESGQAIELTRRFLDTLVESVDKVRTSGGTLKEAYTAARNALVPEYGGMPVFEHAMVFDTQRVWDELQGKDPVIWTSERDREVWGLLTD